MERLLLPRLNEALSSVFEGIEAEQVEASFLRGRLLLRNLRVKREALAPTSLPIDISFGSIERLEVKFSLLRLFSAPVFVRLHKALVVATTRPSASWSVEEETANRDDLRRLVLLTDECLTFAREGHGLPSLLQRLLYAFIRRLRIEASQVELRLEETEISERQPFALGVSLGRLSTVEETEFTGRSAPEIEASRTQPQTQGGWLRWLAGLASRSGGASEKPNDIGGSSTRAADSVAVPSFFSTELRLEDAALYLEPLNTRRARRREALPWIPQPAAYRTRLLKHVEQLVQRRSQEETRPSEEDAQEADAESLDDAPPALSTLPGEFAAQSSLLRLSQIRRALQTREKQSAASSPTAVPGEKSSTLCRGSEKDASPQSGAASVADSEKGRFCGVRPCPSWGDGGSAEPSTESEEGSDASQSKSREEGEEEEDSGEGSRLRGREKEERVAEATPTRRGLSLNDVVDPEALWRKAEEAASRHVFIFRPTSFRVKLRCTQRPVLADGLNPQSSSTDSRAFRRPVRDPANSESIEDDVLPALSVGFVFADCSFAFSPFQLASILRWSHYGFILYQEVVGGVYTDLMEAKPSPSEVEAYKGAWRRHLIASAVAACGLDVRLGDNPEGAAARGEGNLSLGGAVAAADALPDDASQASYEESLREDAKTIQRFEEAAWFPQVLNARREALHALREEVLARLARGEFEKADKADALDEPPPVEGAAPPSPSAGSGLVEASADGVAEAEAEKVHALMEGVAGELAAELSLASAADQEVMGKLLKLTSLRISKSFRLSLELERASIALVGDNAGLLESRSALLSVASFYAHLDLYYDFRFSFASAVRGVRLVDSLSPSLALRGVLLTCPRSRRREPPADQPRSDFATPEGVSSPRIASSSSSATAPSQAPSTAQSKGNSQRPSSGTREAVPPPSPLQGGSHVCCFSVGEGGVCDLSCGGGRACACLVQGQQGGGLDGRGLGEDAGGDEEALPGAWLRFDQVYVPLPGIPDRRLYLQTTGVHLLTLSPEALAFVASLLVAPVELGERKAILSRANSHVQNAIRRNEVFTAQLLVGEVEPLNADICIDVPAPQLVLLPFKADEASSEGLLLQSGVWSADSRIQLPRASREAFHAGLTRLCYDRYAVAGAGCCVYRVLNSKAVQKSLAGKTADGSDLCPSGDEQTPRRRGKSGKEEGRARRPSRREKESQNKEKIAAAEDRSSPQVGLLVKPTGIQLCADLCHFRDPPGLPAFRVWLQNSAPVCVRVTDGDIKKSVAFLAKLAPLLPSAQTPAPKEADLCEGAETGRSSAQTPEEHNNRSASSSPFPGSQASSSFSVAGRRGADREHGVAPFRAVRLSHHPSGRRSQSRRKSSYFYAAAQSASLSSGLSSENSDASHMRGYSAIRRATLYIHRALKSGRTQGLHSEAGGALDAPAKNKAPSEEGEEAPLWLGHWRLAEENGVSSSSPTGVHLASSVEGASSSSSSSSRDPGEAGAEEEAPPEAASVCDERQLCASPLRASFEEEEEETQRRLSSSKALKNGPSSSAPPVETRASLVSFEVLCAFHHTSLHFVKEAGEGNTAGGTHENKGLERELFSCAVGSSRLRLASSPQNGSIHCWISMHEVFAAQECPPSKPTTPPAAAASAEPNAKTPPPTSLRQRLSIVGLSARNGRPFDASSAAAGAGISGVTPAADSASSPRETRVPSPGGGISPPSVKGLCGRVFGSALHLLRFEPSGFLECPSEGGSEAQRLRLAMVALAAALGGHAPLSTTALETLSASGRFRFWSRFCFPPLYPGERRGEASAGEVSAAAAESEEVVVRDLLSGLTHCLSATLVANGLLKKDNAAAPALPVGPPDVFVETLLCFRVLAVSARVQVRPCRLSVDWKGLSALTDTLVELGNAAASAFSQVSLPQSSPFLSASPATEPFADAECGLSESVSLTSDSSSSDGEASEAVAVEGEAELASSFVEDRNASLDKALLPTSKTPTALPAFQVNFRVSLQRVEVVLPAATPSPLADLPVSAVSWGSLKASVFGEGISASSASPAPLSVPRVFSRAPPAAPVQQTSPRKSASAEDGVLRSVAETNGFDGSDRLPCEGTQQTRLPLRKAVVRRDSATFFRRGSGLGGMAQASPAVGEEELAALQTLLEASPPVFVASFTCAFSYATPAAVNGSSEGAEVLSDASLSSTSDEEDEAETRENAPVRTTHVRAELKVSRVRLSLLTPAGHGVKASPAFLAETQRLASRSPREAFFAVSRGGSAGWSSEEEVDEARWSVATWTLTLLDVYGFARKLRASPRGGAQSVLEGAVAGSSSVGGSFSQSGSEAAFGPMAAVVWNSQNAAGGASLGNAFRGGGLRSHATPRRAQALARRLLPVRHGVVEGFAVEGSLQVASLKGDAQGEAELQTNTRCTASLEVDPIAITLDPPVVAHSLFLAKVVCEVFGFSQESADAAGEAPQDQVASEEGGAHAGIAKDKEGETFSKQGTAAADEASGVCADPDSRARAESEAKDGLDEAEKEEASALFETATFVWQTLHSIRASVDVRLRVELVRVQCQALHVAVEEFTSWALVRPQTPPPLAQEAPAESESKKRSSPGGARLTTWIHNNPSAEGHRRKSLSVLVEGQRRLSANVNKLLADDASSKTSADQVGERDRDTHPSAARPPPLECELACGFEVLVSVDGLHRSQMSLESVVEPWFCSASLSYTPAALLLQSLPTGSNRHRTHVLGAKPRVGGLSGRLEKGVGASFRETAMHLLPSQLRGRFASGVQTAAHNAVSPSRRDAKGPLPSRTQKLRELARAFGQEGAEVQGGIECSWLNLTLAPFVVDAFMETADAVEEAHRATTAAVSSLYAAAVYVHRNGLTDFRATASESPAKRLAFEMISPLAPPGMPRVSSGDSSREAPENKSLRSGTSASSSASSSSSSSSSSSATPPPLREQLPSTPPNEEGERPDGDASESERGEATTQRERQSPDAAEAPAREGAPSLVNLTGQTIALRFARPRGKGPSAAGPDFPANKLPSEAPSSQQASEEWRAGAANETFQNLGAPTQLSSNSPLHEGSAGSEAGLPSPLRNLLPEENFEWRIVAPDETVTLPQDDHGQPLAVAVRVQLVGHEFDVSDLRLDTSHAEVRLLPLKIAVEAKGASGSADAARRRRLFSMLSFRARLVVRTVFLPEHRTFHVFLSSALSLRNYSQHAILVFPHPCVARLEKVDGALDARASSAFGSELEASSSLCSPSPELSRQNSGGSPTAVKSQPPRGQTDPSATIPQLPRLPSLADRKPSPPSLASDRSNGSASPKPPARSPEVEVSPSQPLEVCADGGAVNVPLRWILPRAVVYHGLQWYGASDTRSSSALSRLDRETCAATRPPEGLGQGEGGERAPDGSAALPQSRSKWKLKQRSPSAPPSTAEGVRSAFARRLFKGLFKRQRRNSAGPAGAADGEGHDRRLSSTPAVQGGRSRLEEWQGDASVENLLALPLQTFLAGVQKLREEKARMSLSGREDGRNLDGGGSAALPDLPPPRSLRSAGDVEDMMRRDSGTLLRQTSLQQTSFQQTQSQQLPTLASADGLRGGLSFGGSRDASTSPTAGLSYEELYDLAVKLGAQPLLKASALQRIAEAGSNSVGAYAFKPHVLEFSAEGGGGGESDAVALAEKGSFELVGEKLRGGLQQQQRSFAETCESGCLAFAVSVCATSRELLSEADPLFFQVALSPPLSVGNRLFESLRVSVLSNPLLLKGRPLVAARSLSVVSSAEGGVAHPQNASSPSSFKVNAGADVAVERVTKGLVFSFETSSVSNPFRFVFASKPLLVDYHAEAASSATPVDVELSFARTAVLKPDGSALGADSALYRSVVRSFPAELCLVAEVAGAAPREAFAASGGQQPRVAERLAWAEASLLNLQKHVWGSCARSVKVFAPYWVANRQTLPLLVSQKHQPAQCLGPCDWRLLGVPIDGSHLLSLALAVDKDPQRALSEAPSQSLPTQSQRPQLQQGAAVFRPARGSKNCRPFRVDILGRPLAVLVPPSQASGIEKRLAVPESARRAHLFGVTVALAPPPFARSKIVNIFCRFSLRNNFGRDLWIKDGPAGGGLFSVVHLPVGAEMAFHPQSVGARGDALIALSLVNPESLHTLAEAEASSRSSLRASTQNDHQQRMLSASRRTRVLERAVWTPCLSLGRSTSFQIRMRLPQTAAAGRRAWRSTASQSKAERPPQSARRPPGASLWRYENLQVEVQAIEGTSFRVLFSAPTAGDFLLVNKTSRLLAFAQSGIREKFAWEMLGRDESLEFAWPDPLRERRLLRVSVLEAGGQSTTRAFEISRIKPHRPIVLPGNRGRVQLTTDVQDGRRRVVATEAAADGLRRAPSGVAFGGALRSLFKKNSRSSRSSSGRRLLRRSVSNKHKNATASASASSAFRRRTSSSAKAAALGFLREGSHMERLHWQIARRRQALHRKRPSGGVGVSVARDSAGGRLSPRKNSEEPGVAGAARKVLRFRFAGNAQPPPSGSGLSPSGSGYSASEEEEDEDEELSPSADASRRLRRLEGVGFLERRKRGRRFGRAKLKGGGVAAASAGFLRPFDSRLSAEALGPLSATPPGEGRAQPGDQGVASSRRRRPQTQQRGHSFSSEADSAAERNPSSCHREPEAEEPVVSLSDLGCHVSLRVGGFGLSVVDASPQELAYVAGSDFRVEVRRLHAAAPWNFRLSLRCLQIDNGVSAAHDRTILRRMTLEERAKHHGGEGRRTRGALPSPHEDSLLGSGSASSEAAVKSLLRSHIFWSEAEERAGEDESLFFRAQFGGERLREATLLEYVDVSLAPLSVHFEADTALELLRFVLRLLRNRGFFIRSIQDQNILLVRQAAVVRGGGEASSPGFREFRGVPSLPPSSRSLARRPLYVQALCVRPMVILFSARAPRLNRRQVGDTPEELVALRPFEIVGGRIADITDLPLKARSVVQVSVFSTTDKLLEDIAATYAQQGLRQLHKLVASIDLLGNPLALVTGVLASVRALFAKRDSAEEASLERPMWAALANDVARCLVNVAGELVGALSNLFGAEFKLLELLGVLDVSALLALWPNELRVERRRLEKPENFLDGLKAAGAGSVQVLLASVVSVVAFPLRGLRLTGVRGCLRGALSGVLHLFLGVLSSPFIAATALTAGASSSLRQTSLVARTRPPRVFAAGLAVRPYGFHEAQAFGLLQSCLDPVMPASLRPFLAAYPLSSVRSAKARGTGTTATGAGGDGGKASADRDERRAAPAAASRDYLVETGEFLACLRQGQLSWVCRKEDLRRCSVKAPAFVAEALRAQQEMLVHRRGGADRTSGGGVASALDAFETRSSNATGALFTVSLQVHNALGLTDAVLRSAPAACRTYLQHAAEKRGVVQAIKKKLGFRGSNDSAVAALNAEADVETYRSQIFFAHAEAASSPAALRRHPRDAFAAAAVGRGEDVSIEMPESLLLARRAVRRAARRRVGGPTRVSSTEDKDALLRSLRAAPSTSFEVFLTFFGRAATGFKRWIKREASRVKRRFSSLAGRRVEEALRASASWGSATPPETFTLEIALPDSASAFRVFDVISSLIDARR